jgi:hypothetical protein
MVTYWHGDAQYESFQVEHRATIYRIHVLEVYNVEGGGVARRFVLAESGWGPNYGEWMSLNEDKIARSYLAEKMPLTWKREGDWDGWKMVFDKAGIEVFG